MKSLLTHVLDRIARCMSKTLKKKRCVECVLFVSIYSSSLFHGLAYADRSGTGFFVSKSGHVMTNAHVVSECAEVSFWADGRQHLLMLIGTDEANDLAVLQVGGAPSHIATFREGRPIRPGDDIMVVGFPLRNLLSDDSVVTTGTVSARAGLQNNSSYLQISAPIQPGNSGGPVLDSSGLVVGVATAFLDSVKMMKERQVVPQNVNFAVNGSIAKAFLDAHDIPYVVQANVSQKERSEIADLARRYTVSIRCHDQKKHDRVVLGGADSSQETERLKRILEDIVDRDHPGWREIVKQKAWAQWLSSKPESEQRLILDSWDPSVIGNALTDFKRSHRGITRNADIPPGPSRKITDEELDAMLKKLTVPEGANR